jgi:5-methylcytosine-specific restriction endonuclease McrA
MAGKRGGVPTPTEITEPQWKTLEAMAGDGCTHDEMAAYLGISKRTLYAPHLRERMASVTCVAQAHRQPRTPKVPTCRDCGLTATSARFYTRPLTHCAECWSRRQAARLRRGIDAPHAYTPTQWRRLVNRHAGRCAYCGIKGPLSADHVIPISRGGRGTIGNILPACRPCNSSKSNSLLVEWRARCA